MTARIIIADDHVVVRQGLRYIINATVDLRVVAEAADGATAKQMAQTVPADLLVLDVALPDIRGLSVLGMLRAEHCDLPVLLFSMYPPGQYAAAAKRAGAQGYVCKDADSTMLIKAVRQIIAGGTAFPASSRPAKTSGRLSAREAEVMRQLAQGISLVMIAADLGITVKSVNTYRRRVLDKLGLSSNAEIAVWASTREDI